MVYFFRCCKGCNFWGEAYEGEDFFSCNHLDTPGTLMDCRLHRRVNRAANRGSSDSEEGEKTFCQVEAVYDLPEIDWAVA